MDEIPLEISKMTERAINLLEGKLKDLTWQPPTPGADFPEGTKTRLATIATDLKNWRGNNVQYALTEYLWKDPSGPHSASSKFGFFY